jgi:hypothetical protein
MNRLSRATLKSTSLSLREAAPNSETLVMCKSVFKTFGTNIAGKAYSFSFASRAALLRKKSFGISLSTKCALLPGKLNALAIGDLDYRT